MKHELKTLNPYFQEIWNHRKTFEIRKNDRNFQVGDEVKLREYVVEHDTYTGRSIIGVVTYLTDYQQQPGYVVFSLQDLTFHGGL